MAEVLLASAREANAKLVKEMESYRSGDAAVMEAMWRIRSRGIWRTDGRTTPLPGTVVRSQPGGHAQVFQDGGHRLQHVRLPGVVGTEPIRTRTTREIETTEHLPRNLSRLFVHHNGERSNEWNRERRSSQRRATLPGRLHRPGHHLRDRLRGGGGGRGGAARRRHGPEHALRLLGRSAPFCIALTISVDSGRRRRPRTLRSPVPKHTGHTRTPRPKHCGHSVNPRGARACG